MIAEFTAIPTQYVIPEKLKITDITKIVKIIRHWDAEVLVYDVKKKESYSIVVKSISVYDHQIIVDGVQYMIINMFSRPAKLVELAVEC